MSDVTLTTIPYDEAIKQVNALIGDAEKIQWKLGQIADRIQPKYGKATLEAFAHEVGVNYKTLLHYQRVYRAYGVEISERPEISFSAAAVLVKHPDRVRLLTEKPTMTYREAEERMEEFQSEKEEAARADHREPDAPPEVVEEQSLLEATEQVINALHAFLEFLDSKITVIAARIDELDADHSALLREEVAAAKTTFDTIAVKVQARPPLELEGSAAKPKRSEPKARAQRHEGRKPTGVPSDELRT